MSVNDPSIMNHGVFVPVWDDLRVALSSARQGASTPTFSKVYDDGSGSVGVYAWEFGKAADQDLQFAVQIPHAWKTGTVIHPHIHWMEGASTGNVVWQFEYNQAPINSAFSANSTIDSITVAGTASGLHKFSEFSAITLTDNTVSQMLLCSISRLGTDVADTYDDSVYGLEFDFHILKDALGSRGEYTK